MTFENPLDGEKQAIIYNAVPWVMEYDAATRAWKPVINLEDVIAVTITGSSLTINPGTYVNATGVVILKDGNSSRLADVELADGGAKIEPNGLVDLSLLYIYQSDQERWGPWASDLLTEATDYGLGYSPVIKSLLLGVDGDSLPATPRYYNLRLDPQLRLQTRAFVTGTVSSEMISGSLPWKNIQRSVVNVSGTGGEALVVSAIPGQRIKVTELMLVTDAANQIVLQSGFTGTPLTGPITLPASGDKFELQDVTNPTHFHIQTAIGEALVIDRNAASLIGGYVNYFLEP